MIVDVIFIFAQNHIEASNYRKLEIPPFGFPRNFASIIDCYLSFVVYW
jgi:hypothetical protein